MADINLGVGGANSAVGGYDIDNSLKMESDNTEYLSRTNASAGNSKTFTFSGWYKFTEINTLNGNALFEVTGGGPLKHFSIYTYDYRIGFYDYLGGVDYGKRAAQVCRDTSAWYHIHVQIDTTEATASDRSKFYINGVRVTEFDRDHGDFPLNFDTQANKVNEVNRIGRTEHMNGQYLNGYVAEVHLVDGQALAPTDFGEFDADTGIWKPIETSVSSYGTNGFYLKFDNSSDLGEDASGGSSFTLTNVTSVDQATDTPTNNFCIPQITQYYNTTDTILFTEGGTKLTTGSGTGWRTMQPTVSLANGKWYFEVEAPATNPTSSGIMIAITPTKRWTESAYASFYAGQASGDGIGWYLDSTRFRYDDGTGITPPTNTLNAGDIIGIALDMDNNFVYSSINGSWLQNQSSVTGVPTSGASGTGAETVSDEPHMIGISMYSPSKTININYGGYTTISIASGNSDANGYGNFEYAPPSGYYAICSKNLAEFG